MGKNLPYFVVGILATLYGPVILPATQLWCESTKGKQTIKHNQWPDLILFIHKQTSDKRGVYPFTSAHQH